MPHSPTTIHPCLAPAIPEKPTGTNGGFSSPLKRDGAIQRHLRMALDRAGPGNGLPDPVANHPDSDRLAAEALTTRNTARGSKSRPRPYSVLGRRIRRAESRSGGLRGSNAGDRTRGPHPFRAAGERLRTPTGLHDARDSTPNLVTEEITLHNRRNPLPIPSTNAVSARNRTRRTSPAAAPRLALSPVEAATCLGCSRDFFDEHVLPELRAVRKGRKVLVSIQELERWLAREGALTLEAHR